MPQTSPVNDAPAEDWSLEADNNVSAAPDDRHRPPTPAFTTNASAQAPVSSDAEEGAAIVRNIASFLTFSDVASMTSLGGGGGGFGGGGGHWGGGEDGHHLFGADVSPADSWVVGSGSLTDDHPCLDLSWSVATPPTPALVAVSPGATPANFSCYVDHHKDLDDRDDDDSDEEEDDDDSVYLEHVLQRRRRRWAQEKLASAVFAHPQPVRNFCLDAYAAAQDIRKQQEEKQIAMAAAAALKEDEEEDPETWVEPRKQQQQHSPSVTKKKKKRPKSDLRLLFIHNLVDFLDSVPLSVLFDVMEVCVGVSLDTTFATFQLTIKSINGTISAFAYAVWVVWDTITNFNPFQLLEAIISLQFNAMGKTSEVLVSGIQSVATGMGSASSIALHRLSAANLSISHPGSSQQVASNDASARHRGHHRGSAVQTTALNKKLLRKMSSLNEAARVVSYLEMGDETGGLTRHAISRTRRMMHYSVSLRPFVATVAVKQSKTTSGDELARSQDSQVDNGAASDSNNNDLGTAVAPAIASDGYETSESSTTSPPASKDATPFICSPQSFPPTPRSRQMVLARGSQFADDVVFLARDRLRIHDGLESGNERTREMSWALREGKRLAIFDGHDVNGIQLTCGQHIATKVGNMPYACTRSMVPILRNVYVYFEITVMCSSVIQAPVTLSIGLSTVEMPPNTLVGAWQGSVGLCTTGQIFVAGQWCGTDPSTSAYGPNATVGCLVFLDDFSAFETWDGVMVNASVTFSINGILVPPPVSKFPLPGAAAGRGGACSQTSNSAAPHLPPGTGEGTSFTMPTLLVPASEELYPTVTLQTPATAVMCRFSSEDVISRTNVGAPSTATVYAVDGSVIYNPEDP